jgi:uncharacterized lipoprotein NlpE involved in copper resistance
MHDSAASKKKKPSVSWRRAKQQTLGMHDCMGDGRVKLFYVLPTYDQ